MRDCETVALCSWKPRLMSQLAFTSSAYRLGVQIACALTAVALAGSEYCRRVPIACEETCSHLFLICHWVHFQSTSFAGSGSWTQTTTRSGPEVVHFGPLLNRAQLGPLRPTSVTYPVFTLVSLGLSQVELLNVQTTSYCSFCSPEQTNKHSDFGKVIKGNNCE